MYSPACAYTTPLTIVGSDLRHVLHPQLIRMKQLTKINEQEGVSVLVTHVGAEGVPLSAFRLDHHTEGLPGGIGNLFCANHTLQLSAKVKVDIKWHYATYCTLVFHIGCTFSVN